MNNPGSSRWKCKECGQLYGHNPGKCDVCGYTVFRPVPLDDADSFEGGKETTELGADVSELLKQVGETDDRTGEKRPENNISEKQEGSNTENDRSLLSFLPWF